MDLMRNPKPLRMKSPIQSKVKICIFVCVTLLLFTENISAISDPREITTKPPIRREAGLPWYLNDSEATPPEEYAESDPLIRPKNSGKKNMNYIIESIFQHPPVDKQFKESPNDGPSRYVNGAVKKVNRGTKNNIYEGITTNSKKPTLVKIVAPFHSSQVTPVAKYDEQSGTVQCPSPEATGQFIYPVDCKFFVNCHQGRAYVQPCAPGTLFNPDTLECDFPNKVKCYGEENADYTASYQETPRRRELHSAELNQQSVPKKPECPPGHTGLLPHPDTCTKFLQCASGGTFIMDCGPGTAFNPKISVCDWPYNVPACSKDRPSQSSGQSNEGDSIYGGSSNVGYGRGQRPSQYGNYGGTSGDGRGTYEWNRPSDRGVRPTGQGRYEGPGSRDGRYNGQINGYNGGQRPSQYGNYGEMIDVRHETETGDIQKWNGAGQQSVGSITNAGRRYDQSGSPDDRYSGQVTGTGREQWKPQYGNQDESQTVGQWNNDGYILPGNANHQRGTNRQFGFNPSNPWQGPAEFDQTQNRERVDYTGESSNNQGRYVNIRNEHGYAGSGSWNGAGGYQRPEDEESDLSQVSSTDVGNQDGRQGYQHNYGHHDGAYHHQHDHQHYPNEYNRHYGSRSWQEGGGATPATPGYEYPTNDRTSYGRTNTDFSNRQPDGTFSPNNNPGGKWKTPIGNVAPGASHNDYYPSRPDWNRETVPNYNNGDMRPSQPESKELPSGVFVPSSWRGHGWTGHGNSELPTTSNGRPPIPNVSPQNEWNQGGNNNPEDAKLDDWLSKTNVIQGGNKRKEQDTKMDDWSSKTNIFNAQRANKHQGVKTSSSDFHKQGPSGIYVNVNGTRGHYITKEIEVNQGHSNTRIYGQETTEVPPYSNSDSHVTTAPARRGSEKPTHFDQYKPPVRSNSTIRRWKPMRYKPINETKTGEAKPSIYSKPNDYIPNKPDDKLQTSSILTTEKSTLNYDSFTRTTWDRDPRTDSGIELPTVAIEDEYHHVKNYTKKNGKDKETIDFGEVVEPDVDNYQIEVFEKESWKPRLTFQNKTKKPNVESVIMGINKKNVDVEIVDFKLEPWHEEEPPFPVYYIAPVYPLGHTAKPRKINIATGQVLRLRGGSSPRDGYLEVQGVHPGWGTVCDSRNSWSLNEAHVVCRQLGYTRGAEMAWQGQMQRDEAEVPWIASTRVDCSGNETRFQNCKFIHGEECLVKRDAVGIRCMANHLAHCRDDEVAHGGQCYHLANPDSGLNHAEALEYCSTRKAQLIDITSQAENDFLSEWLIQNYPNVTSVMTSGVGFTTLNRTLWLWEDSARAKFQFNKWWPGWLKENKIPPKTGSRPVCVVLKKRFPCHDNPGENCTTDYFFWDVEDCATSMKGHSYVCERPYDDISCVYGKGQLYAGKANVSVSGKKCLPWNDKTLAHALQVNVLNSEVRKELMTHNYCRNPNPMKESRPWCFIGSYGEREYCDIPACGEMGSKRSPTGGKCKPKHFECMPGECIPSPWVCDGEEDCTNGIDEAACSSHLGFFKKTEKHRLDGHDVEKWLNTPSKTCALRCKEADFTCRSFSHKSEGNICLLSDTNVGISGDLVYDVEFDYYEMNDRTINCDGLFVCGNGKCLNRTKVCDGKNDCGDRSDENVCTIEQLDYDIRLVGSNNTYEGRLEVKVMGNWGQVCDDGFGMIDANVVCKELGFALGALEVTPGGYFGNMEIPDRFMVDQLKCRGNETSLRECDFEGWGVHNCRPEEAVGVVCKSAVNTCQLGQWKCDTSPTCIATAFICDEVEDCPDKSDESPVHCMAPFELRLANGSSPLEGRVEIRHHGVWGTVCDDDFTHSAAKVICKSLGYGGEAIAKKNGFFGPGDGPIWLDEVFCHGNETQLYKCEHNPWGRHNCDHNEDAGVICAEGSIDDFQLENNTKDIPEFNINEILPTDCGRRPEDFTIEDDGIFQRVVRGSIAPKGSYPWQASLRIRGHSRSSHWCGAVILGPLHVLTAAHCLQGYNKGTYFIRAGDYHSEVDEGTEVEANIEDYYIHEDFGKGQRMNNDIALVLLKGRGISLGEQVMPICLPPNNVEYSPGLNCTISGFGSVSMSQSAQSLNLRYGWVPLLNQSVCQADYVYGRQKISNGMICAGFLDEGVDTCDGDSGGPLACQNNGAFTLYGITSWGHHCGEPNKPGVYVRVAHYRDWIDKKIHESLFGR